MLVVNTTSVTTALFTVNPLKAGEVPFGVVTLTVRDPAEADALIDIVTGKFVAVPPVPIVAVTPDPLNVTAVAPSRFVPEMEPTSTSPRFPLCGAIAVIVG